MYLASWGVFIDGEDLDPFEVAERAKEYADRPIWKITDLETGVIHVIDVDAKEVKYRSGDTARPASRPLASDVECS